MMDLNGNDYAQQTTKVFNQGAAGKVDNVKIKEIVKRQVDDAPNSPDFKVVFEDQDGANLSWSIYYFEPKEGAPAEQVERSQKFYLQRIVALVRAIMGADYVFPQVKDAKDAVNKLLKVVATTIKKEEKLVNLFVTYGTVGYPNKRGYLGLRFFDFIEPADTPKGSSRLFVKVNKTNPNQSDLMERVVEDLPKINESLEGSSEDSDSDDGEWL